MSCLYSACPKFISNKRVFRKLDDQVFKVLLYIFFFYFQNKYSAANYARHIRTTLDMLKANIPKAFVNLVQIFDIEPLSEVSSNGVICPIVTL